MFAPSFTAKFPTVVADPDAFPIYIKSQRAILAATEFVIELNKAVAQEDGDMNPLYERMKDLEASMGPLLAHSETWVLSSTTTSPVDPTEDVVGRSLRCMASVKLNSARIKLHRYCAFFDIPVFSRKHCDLKSLNAVERGEEPKRWPTCSCSSFANPFRINTASSSSNANSSSSHHSPSSDGHGYVAASTPSTGTGPTATAAPALQQLPNTNANAVAVANFPFSSHQSAKICLKSALNIAHSFEEMPYPNPPGVPQPPGAPCLLSPTSGIACPRTMPSFACCAMQCAYALLMVHQKTRSVYTSPVDGPVGMGGSGVGMGVGVGAGDRPMVVNSLLVRLQQGLTSIYATLSNYATAFEALGGMRGTFVPNLCGPAQGWLEVGSGPSGCMHLLITWNCRSNSERDRGFSGIFNTNVIWLVSLDAWVSVSLVSLARAGRVRIWRRGSVMVFFLGVMGIIPSHPSDN